MRNVVIASATRTPIGDFAGTLSRTAADVLGGVVIKEAIRRAGIEMDQVDELIMGNVLPHGLGQNPARQAGFQAGLPHESGAFTVNKVCGSGLKAVMLAAQAIACGDADVVVAGGMENMNLCPYLLPKARTGYRMGNGQVVDAMVLDGLWDKLNDFHMGMTAELVTDKFGISREDMDAFAAHSYVKAIEARDAGRFDEEIVPVEVPRRKKDPLVFDRDETPRPTPLEVLGKLRPAFRPDGGRVTAGNSSKISDGAAAVVVVAEEYAQAHGLQPLARVGAQGAAGTDPRDVLVAPIYSIPKVLDKAGLTLADIELQEINEAFATSTVAIIRQLGIDESTVNVNGGAVALGHPIGASGARVLVTLLHALKQRDATLGMASLCLGGGESVTLVVEKL